MKKNICIFALGMLLMQSCLDDEGNYDYHELIPIEIDETGLQPSYRIQQLNHLIIDPVVKQGGDDSNLEYEWRVFQATMAPNTETGEVVNYVVGNTRKLDYVVTTPPGTYTLSLTATDKTNGVSETTSRELNVESFASVGLMVEHGDEDSTDVSILVNNRMVADVEKDEVKHGVFSTTNGHRVPGAPGRLAYIGNTRGVNIMTKGSKGGFRSRGSDLAVMGTYGEMFSEGMETANFQGYAQWSYNQLLVDNGKLYFVSIPSTTFVPFGIPVFGMDYYADPYIGTCQRGYYYGIIYDRLNRRFLSIDYQRTPKAFKEPGAAAKFDMNNVGMDMVYAEHGFNDHWYCVMHNPNSPQDYYIYECDFTRFDDGNRAVGKYDVSACADMKDAVAFAVGNRSELMYYATETEVKQCNYKTGGDNTLRYTLPEKLKSEGYAINMIQVFKENSHSNNGRLLYIGLYNKTTGEGKLVECPFVETTGEIEAGQMKTYDGFKRITHICYKRQ